MTQCLRAPTALQKELYSVLTTCIAAQKFYSTMAILMRKIPFCELWIAMPINLYVELGSMFKFLNFASAF